MSLSIIIPALNEETDIGLTVQRAAEEVDVTVEIIVADGGSIDNTKSVAARLGCTIVTSETGRAVQMNAGASRARGDILLFLHADTLLPHGYLKAITSVIANKDNIAGAFKLAIDSTIQSAEIIAWAANCRSKLLHFPYGDQGIFLRKADFLRLGGFPELPLLEDFELVRKLRRQGNIAIVPLAIKTSGRRWSRLGFWRTTLINQKIIIGHLLGVSTDVLAGWYRQERVF